MTNISEKLENVRQRIALAARKAGRDAAGIRLVAVSKRHSLDAIREAYDTGQLDFGENYVQEALEKIDALKIARHKDHPIRWHFIGPIQSNKTRAIAESFDWVHTLAREKIARRLNDYRPAHMAPVNVCIQVNIDKEESKSGVVPTGVLALAEFVTTLPRLRLRGLMAIPQPENGNKAFPSMHALYKEIQSEGDFPHWDTLSMGMSADLEIAIANGANIVRIGTDIFGPRET